jgi:hypothetical protein
MTTGKYYCEKCGGALFFTMDETMCSCSIMAINKPPQGTMEIPDLPVSHGQRYMMHPSRLMLAGMMAQGLLSNPELSSLYSKPKDNGRFGWEFNVDKLRLNSFKIADEMMKGETK